MASNAKKMNHGNLSTESRSAILHSFAKVIMQHMNVGEVIKGLEDEISWESSHGLNPNSADNNRIMSSGYTAIEDYINELADNLVN